MPLTINISCCNLGQSRKYIPQLLCSCQEHAKMHLCNSKWLVVSQWRDDEARERCWRISDFSHSFPYKAASKLYFCKYIHLHLQFFPSFVFSLWFLLFPMFDTIDVHYLFIFHICRIWLQDWRVKFQRSC